MGDHTRNSGAAIFHFFLLFVALTSLCAPPCLLFSLILQFILYYPVLMLIVVFRARAAAPHVWPWRPASPHIHYPYTSTYNPPTQHPNTTHRIPTEHPHTTVTASMYPTHTVHLHMAPQKRIYIPQLSPLNSHTLSPIPILLSRARAMASLPPNISIKKMSPFAEN